MNVYDFDKTIYDGDCTLDFILYCARRRPSTLISMAGLPYMALKFALGRADKTAFKQRLFAFLRRLDSPEVTVEEFWQGNIKKIKPWYLAARREDDVVISASPYFLVAPACRMIGVSRVLASNVDINTGLYSGKNCDGAEKVRQYAAEYGDARIDAFYSDSDNDRPLAELAARAYKVLGDEIREWEL